MWWMSLARPKSAIFITLSSVTKTLRAARSLWMHCTEESAREGGAGHVSAAGGWRLTFLEARYSIPRATWKAQDTRSLMDMFSTGTWYGL